MSNTNAFKKLQQKVAQLQQFVANDIPHIIGTEAIDYAKSNFDQQGFDTGGTVHKWKARKDTKPHKLLNQTDNLRESLDYEVNTDGVTITSDRIYANVHNEGLRAGRGKGFTMPQRQFIGKSDALKNKINQEIQHQLTKL